ncbi:Uncharacterised protein [Mycobacteroides abscessus subsp. abscessus]|nr:Uncharacterised protein [Mycobacteroides abscessus subsp. abscessus]
MPSGATAIDNPLRNVSTTGASAALARSVLERSMKVTPTNRMSGPNTGLRVSSFLPMPVTPPPSTYGTMMTSNWLW